MNMKINYEYVLKIIKEVQQYYEVEVSENSIVSRTPSLIRKIYDRLPEFLKDNFFRPIIWGLEVKNNKKKFYYPSTDDKKWSIDFLDYVLNTKPELNLSIFEFESDIKEIQKFVRNKIYLSLINKLEKEKLFDKEDFKYQKEYENFLKNNVKKKKDFFKIKDLSRYSYILPINHIEMPVFYHTYGLKYIPDKVKNSITNKDILDCGAFIGDSSLIFNKHLNPRKIYAFEPDSKNYNLLLKTIKLNNSKNIVPVKIGVGDENYTLKLTHRGSATFIPKYNKNLTKGSEKLEIIKIDDFVKENKLNIGLIKMDIEGFELNAIKGAKETKKDINLC